MSQSQPQSQPQPIPTLLITPTQTSPEPLSFKSQTYPQYDPRYDPPPYQGFFAGWSSPPTLSTLYFGDRHDRKLFYQHQQKMKLINERKTEAARKQIQTLFEPAKECREEFSRLRECLINNLECMACEKEFDEMSNCSGKEIL